MLYETNYFANPLGLRKLNSSPISDMSSSPSVGPSLSPISKTNDGNLKKHQHYPSNNSTIEKPAKKTKRTNVTPTVREVIENKLKRSNINAIIKQDEALNSESEWLNNSNEENLANHNLDKQHEQNHRKSINKSISNNLPYILNENDISNYIDINSQHHQQQFRCNNTSQNDSVQNYSINNYADADVSSQYLNNAETSFYLNNMAQHSYQAGCSMENEYNHYTQYAIAENSNNLIPIYQQFPIEFSSSDNANHSDYSYNNHPHISNYETQYNHQYYHHANEYQQQDSVPYQHMAYYQYQDENNHGSKEIFFTNHENNHTTNIDTSSYTMSYFDGINNISMMQNETNSDSADQRYAYNNENITSSNEHSPNFQINASKSSAQTGFNNTLRSSEKDDSYSDNDDDFSSVISQELEEEVPKEEMVKVKPKAKTKQTKKPVTKKLSKIFNIHPFSHELNSNDNSNSTESFLNSTLTNQQYIQSQLEGVSCKRKRKRILNRLQRAEATMREKRRMLKLNRAFEELRKVLPVSDFAKNKLSRAETLKSAIEYIENMSELLSI